ncbi:MAG: OsmC family protein [Pontibacterium sp.]
MAGLKTISVTANLGTGTTVTADIRDHKVAIDQPIAAGGKNEGPSPLEYFLFSLAGCIGSIARIAAMQQRIELRGMEIKVDASYNPAGLLGKPTEDRIGFQVITVDASIDADLDEAAKQVFLDAVCDRCPLHENIKLETRVDHQLI